MLNDSMTMNDVRRPKLKRRWYQFSLRTLVLFATLLAIACGWYTSEMKKAATRRAAIAEIIQLGGYIKYSSPKWYSLLCHIHGNEYLGNAVRVYFTPVQMGKKRSRLRGTQITDAEMIHLAGLPTLEVLWLERTQITDAGLIHLRGLKKLERLKLCETRITDAGVPHLKGLTNLEYLDLRATRITDARLVHLEGLTSLADLDLRDTQVTDEGVKRLRQALPDCEISH